MPSSHLILCRPFLLLPPIPPSINVFSNKSALRMRWPKYWSFSFSISPSKEHPGLISFRMDWLDLLEVQGTLKNIQYMISKFGEDSWESLGLQGHPTQSILKEISPGCSLEGMMLKLKLQYFGHLMRRVDSLEKTLMLGGIGGQRKRGQQRMSWLDGITNSMDVDSGWTPGDGVGQGGLACCDSWGHKESDTTEQLN